MRMTRRRFLGYAAVSAASAKLQGLSLGRHQAVKNAGIVVLDEHCTIPESASGYRAALGTLEIGAGVVIVPAAVDLSSSTVRLLHNRLDDGAIVVLESGAIFGDATSRAFNNHRTMLRDEFAIELERPMPLWPAPNIPYVHYLWPRPAMVRDYGHAVVLSEQGGVIARVNGLPVAIRRRLGAGTLIFIGSPLGPALLFGDREARAWLSHVISMSPVA